MTDDEKRFREQAVECRKRAKLVRDPVGAKHWLDIAVEYDKLADNVAEQRRRSN